MKKLIIALFSISSFVAYGQCKIEGSEEILINTEQDYYVKELNCKNCYNWTSSNDNIQLNPVKNKVIVKAINEGQSTLTMAIKNGKKRSTCQKILIIKVSESQFKDTPNCSVENTQINYVRINEQEVSFVPSITNENFTFEWEVIYKDGTALNSTKSSPKFLLHRDNSIVSAKLKISDGLCTKEVVSKYDGNYWFKTNSNKVNQIEYKQESYEDYQKRNNQ